MRCTLAFIAAALAGSGLARPTTKQSISGARKFTTVHPGGIDDLIVTKDNTLLGSVHKKSSQPAGKPSILGNAQLPLTFVNNFSGDTAYAYIQGNAPDGSVSFVGADGSFIYPSSGGSSTPVPIEEDIAIPLGSQGDKTDVTMPDFLISGRIYFSAEKLHFFMQAGENGGEALVQPAAENTQDPNADINWGFVEFTNNEDGIYTNVSYVDFVGLVLGMSLESGNGTTQTTAGLTSDAVQSVCEDLATQSDKDGEAWAELCMVGSDGNPLRALSPAKYGAQNGSAFGDYWTSYTDDVWSTYSSSPLKIDTQMDAGVIECNVEGEELVCPDDSSNYPKPTAADIWGCDSGTFGKSDSDNGVHLAVIARLCAAFVRGTLLLEGGDVQPGVSSDKYYTTDPNNHYCRIVHDYEVDGTGYAFPFDDVNPNDPNENASGTLTAADPTLLTIYVGAPPESS